MLCEGKWDHLQTCIPGSYQRCVTWSGRSTDAQWVIDVTPLMQTGCTSASAWAETVQNAPLPSGQVGTRHGNSWVIDDLGVGWRISLPSSSPEVACGRRRVDGPYWPAGWKTSTGWLKMSWWTGTWGFLWKLWMKFAESSVRLTTGGAMWDSTGSHWSGVGHMVPETICIVSFSCLSTNFTCDERPHAGTQHLATE